ncbi:MAG: UDP-N-acetylenolpyruvoylglucosamine reductase [Acidobacteria bacterium]|nr:MAG: UDP-N-acetylenolpyruvoylglucosamine reductase [Acidobacteriota bacterium]
MKALIHENVALALLTTFGIGGPARYFIDAPDEQTVLEAIHGAKEKDLPIFVLGGGSNLLVADAGFPGLVVRIGIRGVEWASANGKTIVDAGAGEEWDRLVASSVERNLSGIECLSGIPGSVGGTPVQNVGAYGQEISEVLVSVRAYDRSADRIVELSHDECGFTYRTSVFNTTAKDRYAVLHVIYALTNNGNPAIRYPELQREFEGKTANPTLAEVRDAVRRIRGRKAMLLVEGDPDCRSAGSFFKNPMVTEEKFADLQSIAGPNVPRYPASGGKVKTAAAWLIEHAGFSKGYSVGPVGLSTKHTLALVNKGGATAADVVRLARQIRSGVRDRFGIELVPEPVLLGFENGSGGL